MKRYDQESGQAMTREEAIGTMARAMAGDVWDGGSEMIRRHFRRLATAALDAALPWVEGLVESGYCAGSHACSNALMGLPFEYVDKAVARVMEGK